MAPGRRINSGSMATPTADFLFIPFAAASELAADAVTLASARYRALLPAEALRAGGHGVELRDFAHVLQAGAADAARLTVIMQPKEQMLLGDIAASYWPALLAHIARQQAAGFRMALDISDLKLGAAYLATLQGRLPPDAIAAAAAQYPALARAADFLVTPTDALAQALRAELGPGTAVHVIPDPVEVPRGAPRFAPPALPDAPLRLLWFGTFRSHAGAVLQMLRHDLAAPPLPTTLTLVCEAIAPEAWAALRQAAGGIPLHHQPWSVADLSAALAACDAVLLPFQTDSALVAGKSNNRALQALQAGRLFLAHDIESYRSLAGFGYVGADLGAGLHAALADPARVLAGISAGQQHLDQHYTPAAIARRWAALL